MLNTSMRQDYDCKFCGKKFHKPTTLSTHMCVKKQRHNDASSTGARFGLRAFQRFYQLTTTGKQIKSQEDFINSQYYIDFVKFGNHLALLKPVYADKYIDFVILNSVKLKDWNKDFVYDLYITDLVKKEPAESAVERAITEILDWCDTNKAEFTKFFSCIHPNEAAHMIRTGRISPWVLYLSATGGDLLGRFTEDHSKIIGGIIDPGVWVKKFKKSKEDTDYITSLLLQAGL